MTDNKFPEPDINSLSDLNGLPLDIFVRDNLTPELAVGVARMLFPEFMEYQDCVFRKQEQDKYFRKVFADWNKSLNGDLGGLERVINHRHFIEDGWYSFLEDLNKQNFQFFVTVMKHTWLAALEAQFPEREFQVSLTYDEHSDDYVITFWQPKNGNP